METLYILAKFGTQSINKWIQPDAFKLRIHGLQKAVRVGRTILRNEPCDAIKLLLCEIG